MMNFDAESSLKFKLCGEEIEKDAIYTIYLKKVRYQNPIKKLALETDDKKSHLEWETIIIKCIKAGTIEKLVQKLVADDGELECTFVNIFLATYRTFTSTEHVLSLLIERYEYLMNNKENIPKSMVDLHKKTITSVLHVWLDSYPEDFYNRPLSTCIKRLNYFTLNYLPKTELHIKTTYRINNLKDLDNSTYIIDNNYINSNYANCSDCIYNFLDISERHFAEQLTRMDRDVLKNMIPYQCLGAVWSKNKRIISAPTVIKTIAQFNAVSLRVISTVLLASNSSRVDILKRWIDISQELRVLKNFSSLKAIISGLQSNSIFRLKKTWNSVTRVKVELFRELAQIFDEENNQLVQRKLLIAEGTAKFANVFANSSRHLQKIIQKQQSMGKNVGTIPYMGTFLTDLTMINSATPDILQNGLINFDKKRKEFEILAQIKLLQGAANSYNINEDVIFDQWFNSILVLDDRQAFKISCQIQPIDNNIQLNSFSGTGNKHNYEHKKNDSLYCSNSTFKCIFDDNLNLPNISLNKQDSLLNISSSYLHNFDLSLNGNTNTNNVLNNSISKFNTSFDFYIIRITVERENIDVTKNGLILYKSIILSNNEHTPQVIRNAMLKFCINDDPENYTLSQILPDKEMILPMSANVYYAINTKYELNFLLRKKKVEL